MAVPFSHLAPVRSPTLQNALWKAIGTAWTMTMVGTGIILNVFTPLVAAFLLHGSMTSLPRPHTTLYAAFLCFSTY